MGEKDDLGLSLSLSFPRSHLHHPHQHPQSLQLNLMPCLVPSSASSAQSGFNLQKRSCNNAFASSSDRNSETRSFLRGIDVNREPSAAADYGEDEAGVSSPNSTASTVSGKRSERDHHSQTNCDDLDNERASSRGGGSDEEDGDMSRKKLRLSKDQSAVLEESFKEHNTLNPWVFPAEAKAGTGEAARAPAQTGGGLVSEQKSEDEVEADGGGLRVPEAVLREPDGGEPAAAEGGAGAAGAQALARVLHAPRPSHHPHHVPRLRARGRPAPLLRPPPRRHRPGPRPPRAPHQPVGPRGGPPRPRPLRRPPLLFL
ncbi:Homeobox domain-containing protein, partial [Psidium guajava]